VGVDVSSYWMTLRKRKDTGIGKRKYHILPYRKLALEEAVDMS
jgi:hypothetical protein